MRYKNQFRNPDEFLGLMNSVVPFLNGGLFECLDIRGEKEKKEDRAYIDGFSDNLPKGQVLIVPDYLFFGDELTVDLSSDIGRKNRDVKESKVRGLFTILNSYKFTITENSPIEEEIALDPELLGQVFGNLLASYNPETKTTARKQTGSFYTPREIVNYMVDESIIAHLRTKLNDDDEAEDKLRRLISYSTDNPFNEDESKHIIELIDSMKILDPACGSGAFPMGVLQKLVHLLQKLDDGNAIWEDRQLDRINRELQNATDKTEKAELRIQMRDVIEAFTENDPDYARKLFLIENCIYGVDNSANCYAD